MGKVVEWPPGSGRKAHYDDDEIAMMRRFIEQYEAKEITFAELQNQYSTLHEFKHVFGQRIPPPGGTGPVVPAQSSLFPIPEKALRQMPRVPEPSAQPAVDAVREEAIERSDRPPSSEWKAHAHAKIIEVASRVEFFTSEQVWDAGLMKPDNGSPDGDALGPAMRRAKDAGIIENTGRLEQATNRPQRHNNPKRVWRSLIFDPS